MRAWRAMAGHRQMIAHVDTLPLWKKKKEKERVVFCHSDDDDEQ